VVTKGVALGQPPRIEGGPKAAPSGSTPRPSNEPSARLQGHKRKNSSEETIVERTKRHQGSEQLGSEIEFTEEDKRVAWGRELLRNFASSENDSMMKTLGKVCTTRAALAREIELKGANSAEIPGLIELMEEATKVCSAEIEKPGSRSRRGAAVCHDILLELQLPFVNTGPT